jgi:deoxyribonuclease-4
MLELGAHMSIAGGCDLALQRAADLGMSACQIFTKNASQWRAKPLDPAVVERFQAHRAATGIAHLVAHDSYLINVASPDDALWEKSRLALLEELERCDLLGVPYLVSHPGGHMGSGAEAGVRRVAEAINRIHDDWPDGTAVLLLETTAGQGTALGRTFDELASIIAPVDDKRRIGACFDTCHVFAAGYELRDDEGYRRTMREFDAYIGLDRLRVFHLNDSKKGLGSRVDRHAHIGEGELGAMPFTFILNDPRFAGLPGILETPKGDDGEEDRRNLSTLRGYIRCPAATGSAGLAA